MNTNCVPLRADLFLIFVAALQDKWKEAILPVLPFRYIDDVLSLNNSNFGDYVDRIYRNDTEINDTTYAALSAYYIDQHIEIDSDGLKSKLNEMTKFPCYDKSNL